VDILKSAQRFFHQLILLYRPFENQLNMLLNEHQLHRAQWTILYYLYNTGEATNVEISQYQSVEKPTVTRAVSRLEELGYIERAPGKDKREKRMRLTEHGVKIYKEIRITIDQFEEEILKGISEEEQMEAIKMMDVIRNNIIK
jgi:MarR family transcriptional regulator, transcriptional regulator for hemolysin